MSANNTFTRTKQTLSAAPALIVSLNVVVIISCCFCQLILLVEAASNLAFTTPQTVLASGRTLTPIQNEQYPTSSSLYGQPLIPTSTGKPTQIATTTTIAGNSNQIQQTKSLKFTLTAGKYWKFNIKSNSFSSHKEAELRLHKNVSLNNYIIDDDCWFQYNPQQQQLFAWPSYFTRPGTYQFVLLPSGIDFEADSENSVNLEVAANIIVELIRPLYQGSSGDIDQLIDHKFSLDYLHRHSSYPLLLNQIVSIFDTISRSNSTTNQSNSSQTFLDKLKGTKSTNKFTEYLLINTNYSSDGEFFSLTWTTQPSLINNTISQISDCRLATISDVVTKLSTLSQGYQTREDKYIVYYPLEASVTNSQAIIPTERGNFALKLTLNSICQRQNIIQDLGLISPNKSLSLDADDGRENNITDLQASSTSLKLNYANSAPGLPVPEAIDSNTALTQITNSTPTTVVSTTTTAPTTTTTITNSSSSSGIIINNNIDTLESTNQSRIDSSNQPDEQQVAKVNKDTLESQIPADTPVVHQQQTKFQPQAKSFANFLDINDVVISNFTMQTTTQTTLSTQSNLNVTEITKNSTDNNPSVVPTNEANVVLESSLNEDFMGILNDVMEYLISIAVPAAIIIGTILIISIIIGCCHLFYKKRKSKQFQVRNRFKFRYGSERRGFLKNSSKPVILEADKKSLSCGGTPMHQSNRATPSHGQPSEGTTKAATYLPMQQILSKDNDNVKSVSTYTSQTTS